MIPQKASGNASAAVPIHKFVDPCHPKAFSGEGDQDQAGVVHMYKCFVFVSITKRICF